MLRRFRMLKGACCAHQPEKSLRSNLDVVNSGFRDQSTSTTVLQASADAAPAAQTTPPQTHERPQACAAKKSRRCSRAGPAARTGRRETRHRRLCSRCSSEVVKATSARFVRPGKTARTSCRRLLIDVTMAVRHPGVTRCVLETLASITQVSSFATADEQHPISSHCCRQPCGPVTCSQGL